TIINIFTLYDPGTGMIFNRTPGAGGTDSPARPAPGSMVNPTPMANPAPTPGASPSPSPSPTPSPAPCANPSGCGTPSENPAVSLSPNPVTQGDTETLTASGFAPNKNLDIQVTRP